MEKVKINNQELKIPGKQGPFGVRLFTTKETVEMGESASKGDKPLHQQYVDICQQSLCYFKSGKQVYQPQQKSKMDKDLGGGKIIHIAQQAMRYNGLMDDADLNQKIEDAEKN